MQCTIQDMQCRLRGEPGEHGMPGLGAPCLCRRMPSPRCHRAVTRTLNAPGSQLGNSELRMRCTASCVSRGLANLAFRRRVRSVMAA